MQILTDEQIRAGKEKTGIPLKTNFVSGGDDYTVQVKDHALSKGAFAFGYAYYKHTDSNVVEFLVYVKTGSKFTNYYHATARETDSGVLIWRHV